MLAENLQHIHTVWFHPGAVRYYRDRDLAVPDELLPPEMREEETMTDATGMDESEEAKEGD
jgi:hypothetical protein